MDLDGVGSPVALAERIHQLLPDLPPDFALEPLCKALDIASIEELQTEGFEAALIADEAKASAAILVAANRLAQRTRFSIAHELGHFLIPTHLPRANCSIDDLHSVDRKARDRGRRIEAEANRFAAHLLMPGKAIRQHIRNSTGDLPALAQMSDLYAVSKEAMARRWVDLHDHPIAIVIAQHSRIVRLYRGDEFPWLASGFGELLPDGSQAAEASVRPGEHTELEEVEPDIWLEERDAERVLALEEQILGQGQGYAIVFLRAELDDE